MKKIIFLLMLLVAPFTVYSKDGVNIKKFHTEIQVNNQTSIIYKNSLDISFGEEEIEANNFLIFPIAKNEKYNNATYTNNIELVNFISPHNNIFGKEEYIIYIGDNYVNFEPEEKIKYFYEVVREESNSADLNFIILQDISYDLDLFSFKIILPEEYKGKDVRFSLDGQKYYMSLEKLDYKTEKNIIEGTYKGKVENGYLSVKVSNVSAIKADIREIIVYISFLILLFTIVFSIYNLKNKRKTS